MRKKESWCIKFNLILIHAEHRHTKCYICKEKKKLTTHHKVPIGIGGLDIVENRCQVCLECHRKLHHIADRKRLNTPLQYLNLLEQLKKENENATRIITTN